MNPNLQVGKLVQLVRGRRSVVVELQAHAVVDFIVGQRDVVLVYGVPFLNPDLLGPSARLSRHQFLQVPDGVILIALDADLQ
jgi:hypothetical protein